MICATYQATTPRPCSGRRELAASPAAASDPGAMKSVSYNTSANNGSRSQSRKDRWWRGIEQCVTLTGAVDRTGAAWPQRAKPVQPCAAHQIAAPASLLNLREMSQKNMRQRQDAPHASDTWGIGKKGQCPCRNSLARNQKNPYRDFAAAMLQPSLGVSSLDFMAASLTRPFFLAFLRQAQTRWRSFKTRRPFHRDTASYLIHTITFRRAQHVIFGARCFLDVFRCPLCDIGKTVHCLTWQPVNGLAIVLPTGLIPLTGVPSTPLPDLASSDRPPRRPV